MTSKDVTTLNLILGCYACNNKITDAEMFKYCEINYKYSSHSQKEKEMTREQLQNENFELRQKLQKCISAMRIAKEKLQSNKKEESILAPLFNEILKSYTKQE